MDGSCFAIQLFKYESMCGMSIMCRVSPCNYAMQTWLQKKLAISQRNWQQKCPTESMAIIVLTLRRVRLIETL